LATAFDPWLNERQAEGRKGRCWSIDSFEAEPQHALIVYGTLADRDVQRARLLGGGATSASRSRRRRKSPTKS
jgi:hypothetical protein